MPDAGRAGPSRQERTTYDRLSRWYDLLTLGSEDRMVAAGLRHLDAAAGARVIDIGCGTARAVPVLARTVGPSGLACGVDLSPGMLAVARSRLTRAAPPAPTALARADARALPFGDGSFDAAFMSFALELFDPPAIPRVLAECARVLKPGGRLCVVALHRPLRPGPPVRMYEWAHRRFPAWIDCRPIRASQLTTEAGFATIRAVVQHMAGLPVEIVLAEKEERRG
jgi:demethylmenaquinone methyltransferase/2-methoxy-6-polyprenyl-1,4-benzoquinol methylase